MSLPTVRSLADVDKHDGETVQVYGTVTRPEMSRGQGASWSGTGLTLPDGTLLWISYAKAPPEAFAEWVGRTVTLQAKVYVGAPPHKKQAVKGSHLDEWTAIRQPEPETPSES